MPERCALVYNTLMVKVSTNLSCVCYSQTVQCSNSNMDNLFAPQSLHHLGLPHMDIGAMAQSEIIAFAPVWKHKPRTLVGTQKGQKMNVQSLYHSSILPGPHDSRFSKSQGELCSTFNLADTLPVEPLDVLGDVAALTASPTQLPKISVTPGEHQP